MEKESLWRLAFLLCLLFGGRLVRLKEAELG